MFQIPNTLLLILNLFLTNLILINVYIFRRKNMRNLIKIFLSVTIITILIIFSDKVNALEVISKEIFEYIIEQTAPEDLDLSFKNGTIYSDKYLKEIEEFNERNKKSNDENNNYQINKKEIYYGITDINQLYYTVSMIFYLTTIKINI
jgi:hypothetical protein